MHYEHASRILIHDYIPDEINNSKWLISVERSPLSPYETGYGLR